MPIRLVLADDHPLMLDGLESLFGSDPEFEVLARCADSHQALQAVVEKRPDVLILDLRMPGPSGAELLRELRALAVPTRVVVLTGSADDDEIFEAVRLGARGVVLKEMAPRLLVQAVRKVHAGERWLDRQTLSRALDELLLRDARGAEAPSLLSARELEIVRLLGQGLRNRQIGERLFIAEGTVKTHLHKIYDKVGVDSRLALLRLAERRGWI